MKDKKLQVFVSSTFTDLIEERQAAVEAILSSGHIPAGMELFAAGDESQMTVIKRWIDESDVYLLILGGRYGSIDKESGKSYTHLEYEYALSLKKPLFAVVITDAALDAKVHKHGKSVIETTEAKQLELLKTQVTGNLVKFFEDKKDIKIAIHETISEFSYRKDLIGWIRGDNQVNTGILAEEIARLTKENSELRTIVESDKKDNALYGSLTFNELQQLLESYPATFDDKNSDLFEFVMFYGLKLVPGRHLPTEINGEILSKLMLLGIVDYDWNTGYYGFSNVGRNFFFKAFVNRRNS